MTAIVAIEHDGKVYMGCDSAGSRDWDLRVRSEEDCKIIERDGWLIGVSGTARWLSLLKAKFTPPPLASEPATFEEKQSYVAEAVEQMYQLAKEYDLIGEDKMIDAAVLIGFQGQIWIVDSGFGLVHHAYSFAAVGCGDQIALGALGMVLGDSFKWDYSPTRLKGMVREALVVAERFSAGVRAPFVVKSV